MPETVIGMNILDLALLVVIIVSTLISLMRGFAREFLGILGWIGAVFITLYGFQYVRPLVRKWIETTIIADITAGASLFVVSLIVLTLFFKAFSDRIRSGSLSGLDRSLGLIFGIIRGYLIVCMVYLVGVSMTKIKEWPSHVTQARSLPFIEKGSDFLKSLLPADFRPKDADRLNLKELTPEELVHKLSKLHTKPVETDDKKPDEKKEETEEENTEKNQEEKDKKEEAKSSYSDAAKKSLSKLF